MVEKIQNIGVTLPAQNIAPAKEHEKHDNKESNDFVKKHATELAIGAAAVAAAVIGGIIYARKGKGDDVIKDLTKNNDYCRMASKKTNIEPNASKVESKAEAQPKQNGSQVEKQGSQVESRPAGESNSAPKLIGKVPNATEQALIMTPPKDERKAIFAKAQKQLDNYSFLKEEPMTFAKAGGKPGQTFVEIKNDKEQLVKIIRNDGNTYHYNPESGKLLYEELFDNGVRYCIGDYTTNEKFFLKNGEICVVTKYKSNDGSKFSNRSYLVTQYSGYYTKYEGKIGTQYGFDENLVNTSIVQRDDNARRLLDFNIHPDGSISYQSPPLL